MIPDKKTAIALWDKYDLPSMKRRHVTLVAAVAIFIAEKLVKKGCHVDMQLLEAAALLHDIDKNVKKLPGEIHPDAGVRILIGEGMGEVAELIRRHPLHAILDPVIAPDTLETKILFLSDKMVKQDIIDVDRRFALWYAEDMPVEAIIILKKSYPLVKKLEKEICNMIGVLPGKFAKLVQSSYTAG